MPEQNKNIIHYSTTDIQKYLEGKLSVQEMHAIEKAALEDPFLADAMEGVQNDLRHRRSADFNNDLKALTERLGNRINEKERVIAIWPKRVWPRVAAIAVILIGSAFLIYSFLLKDLYNKEKSVAANEKTAVADSGTVSKPTPTSPSKTDSINLNGVVAANENSNQYSGHKNEPTKADTKKTSIKLRSMEANKDDEVRTDSLKEPNFSTAVIEEKSKDKISNTQTDTLQQITASAAPVTVEKPLLGKAAGISVQRKKFANANFFIGKVTDENKNPVPGASVILKNKKTGTVTDQNGNFRLNNTSNDSSTNVVVNSVGFQPASYTLNYKNAAFNQIQLKPANSALNEAVVVGYGSNNNKKIADSDDTDKNVEEDQKEEEPVFDALPIVGWPAYNDYINQNKKITTADSAIKGKEIISFVVDNNNQLSSFKIKKSLSKAHDAEALRLIKQGPSWRLLKGKKEKITLAIEF